MKYSILQAEGASPSLDFRQRFLKKLQRPIRPIYVGENSAIDGYRILLDRLRQTESDRPANLAVLHIRTKTEGETLFKTLREQEAAAGIKPLPVIIISPHANPLDRKLLAGRECKMMPSPFTLTRLADTVNSLLLPDDL
jgi:hypothetical protein